MKYTWRAANGTNNVQYHDLYASGPAFTGIAVWFRVDSVVVYAVPNSGGIVLRGYSTNEKRDLCNDFWEAR